MYAICSLLYYGRLSYSARFVCGAGLDTRSSAGGSQLSFCSQRRELQDNKWLY